MISSIVALKKHLKVQYHGDGYLLDQLLTEMKVPEMQAELCDRMPRKDQHAIHRKENRLSDQKRSTEEIFTCKMTPNTEIVDHAMYRFRNTFDGQNRKPIKRYGNKSPKRRGYRLKYE